MNRLLAAVVLLGLCGPARSQDLPEFTPQRREVFAELIAAAQAAGAMKVTGKGDGRRLTIDADKMRALAFERKGRWDRERCDTLASAWGPLKPWQRPAVVALLEAFGEETGDRRARGFAALLSAYPLPKDGKNDRAVEACRRAIEHFAAAGDALWEGGAHEALATLHCTRDEYARAVPHLEKAVAL